MTKYKIEGGVDFFSELYKSLDDEDNEENEDNLCLITNLPLVDKYFQMDCGHKFNYIPLFFDIKNHKQKFNSMEGSTTRLTNNEIRCPYCRKKHKGVLPYYQELGLPKIEGVNNINPNYKVYNGSNYKQCQFLIPNSAFDPNGNNVLETSQGNVGNCKFHICFHMGSKINFQYGIESGENYGDDKYYCYTHKKQMIKKYKTEIATKAKEEAKQAKLLAKEEAKKQKAEEKQKAKDEKKQKKPVISVDSENLVLSNNIFDASGNVTIEGCLEILKSGKNKGTHCGCSIHNNNMCKRHYNLNQKNLENAS